jgi:UDP-N-acetylmuramoyl-L-alanyl-D-glutamate--2,6-diaminopimelate ligase
MCADALRNFSGVRGRAEFVSEGQPFDIVVDYAHTPDSLKNIYETFYKTRICVLGGTGGGRDAWKRKEMGRIADEYCSDIILTNEDPYDENPRAIVDDIAKGITKNRYEVIMDRREAIHRALSLATAQDVVLITGKGTDPYIMGARGTKIPWDDADVVREELERIPRKILDAKI